MIYVRKNAVRCWSGEGDAGSGFFLLDCNLLLCGVLFVVVDVATVAATAVDANFALYLIIFI